MRGLGNPVEVVGAGPAGLAAAITLAQAGQRVLVHEAQRTVGYRFQRDFQGLENWSKPCDVLEEFRLLGIDTHFRALPCSEGSGFDAWDHVYPIHSAKPLFYMVERGPGDGSLDTALLAQAQAGGVEVRFGSRLDHLEGAGIVATGPKAADAIAVGYHFETDLPDGFWVVLDDEIAPRGYAYLLVMGGRGTVKTCMFSDFKHERQYVERTVERFERLVGMRMSNERFHGGVGNFRLPASAVAGRHLLAGEHAGFQDTFAGFGIRYAIESGVLAARTLLGGEPYDNAWRARLKPSMEHSVLNRALYSMFGNRGYRWLLRIQTWNGDTGRLLHWAYRPGLLGTILRAWAQRHYTSARHDQSCDHVDCECVWCRCGVSATPAD